MNWRQQVVSSRPWWQKTQPEKLKLFYTRYADSQFVGVVFIFFLSHSKPSFGFSNQYLHQQNNIWGCDFCSKISRLKKTNIFFSLKPTNQIWKNFTGSVKIFYASVSLATVTASLFFFLLFYFLWHVLFK